MANGCRVLERRDEIEVKRMYWRCHCNRGDIRNCKAGPTLHTSLVVGSRSPALTEESLATSGLDVTHGQNTLTLHITHLRTRLVPSSSTMITVHSHRCNAYHPIKVDPLSIQESPNWVHGPLKEVLPRAEGDPPQKKIPADIRRAFPLPTFLNIMTNLLSFDY